MCLNFLCFSSDLCNANLYSTVLAIYFVSGRSFTHALNYVSFIKTLTSLLRLKYLSNLFLLDYDDDIFSCLVLDELNHITIVNNKKRYTRIQCTQF